MNYLARVHTGSEPNDNIKLANWTPNNGPFSYNFRQFIVQFTFRSREIEFFGKIFRVSALTLCHQGFISLQRFVLPLPLKGQVSTLVEISAIHTIEKYLLYSFYSVALNTNFLFRSIKMFEFAKLTNANILQNLIKNVMPAHFTSVMFRAVVYWWQEKQLQKYSCSTNYTANILFVRITFIHCIFNYHGSGYSRTLQSAIHPQLPSQPYYNH